MIDHMTERTVQEPTAGIPVDSIANRLILARHLAGHLSIREAAARCSIGRGAWQNWERGNSVGIADSFHATRHRFCTQIYRVSGDLRLTQHLAGHSSPATTSQYVAWSDPEAVGALAALP